MCQEIHKTISQWRADGYSRDDAWRLYEMARRVGGDLPVIGRGVWCHYWVQPLAVLTKGPAFQGATHMLKESYCSWAWRVQLLEENHLLSFWRWVSVEGVVGCTRFDLADLEVLPGAYDGALEWKVIWTSRDLVSTSRSPALENGVHDVHLAPSAELGGGAVVVEPEGTDWAAWDKAVGRILSESGDDQGQAARSVSTSPAPDDHEPGLEIMGASDIRLVNNDDNIVGF